MSVVVCFTCPWFTLFSSLLFILSSPHPSLHLPAVCSCVSQRSELQRQRRETETFHRFPRGKRERQQKLRAGFQRLLLILVIFFLVVSKATLPGLQLHLWRRSILQSAAPRPLRTAPHQRERRYRKREWLFDQSPFGIRVWLLALSPRRQQLLPLLSAGRATAVRRPQDPGVYHG